MKRYRQFIPLLLLLASLLHAASADELARGVFKIPLYPGTETFPFRSTGESLLAPPFGTLTRVYKTSDGMALDAVKVTAFFDEELRAKGWTSDDPQAQADFLVMRTQVYENPLDGTRIQAAGNIKIWVAPKDGIFTVWMQQWRISQPDQKTRDQVATIAKELEDFARTQPVKQNFGKSNSLSWEADYTNEYLIERQQFSMTDSAQAPTSHFGGRGTLFISILTYRDASIAQQELAKRLQNRFSAFDAVVVDKSLVTFEDRWNEQKGRVAALKARLARVKSE